MNCKIIIVLFPLAHDPRKASSDFNLNFYRNPQL